MYLTKMRPWSNGTVADDYFLFLLSFFPLALIISAQEEEIGLRFWVRNRELKPDSGVGKTPGSP